MHLRPRRRPQHPPRQRLPQQMCIRDRGVAVAPTEANKAETVVPDGLSVEEVESSVCELGDITPDETKDFDEMCIRDRLTSPDRILPWMAAHWLSVIERSFSAIFRQLRSCSR